MATEPTGINPPVRDTVLDIRSEVVTTEYTVLRHPLRCLRPRTGHPVCGVPYFCNGCPPMSAIPSASGGGVRARVPDGQRHHARGEPVVSLLPGSPPGARRIVFCEF